MSFLPTYPETLYMLAAFSFMLILSISLLPYLYPRDFPKPINAGQPQEKLVEWERDRVLIVAKGVAGAAGSYFVALIPLVLKAEISHDVSGLAVLGTVVGFFGALILACDITVETAYFAGRNLI